jgi:hypothetical protein
MSPHAARGRPGRPSGFGDDAAWSASGSAFTLLPFARLPVERAVVRDGDLLIGLRPQLPAGRAADLSLGGTAMRWSKRLVQTAVLAGLLTALASYSARGDWEISKDYVCAE